MPKKWFGILPLKAQLGRFSKVRYSHCSSDLVMSIRLIVQKWCSSALLPNMNTSTPAATSASVLSIVIGHPPWRQVQSAWVSFPCCRQPHRRCHLQTTNRLVHIWSIKVQKTSTGFLKIINAEKNIEILITQIEKKFENK